jgi:hypothetical protein
MHFHRLPSSNFIAKDQKSRILINQKLVDIYSRSDPSAALKMAFKYFKQLNPMLQQSTTRIMPFLETKILQIWSSATFVQSNYV